jgi:hypothetical protein
MAGLRTEFDFVLPKGLVDDGGTVHREGTMRLATARDELEPLGDPKVKDADDPYLTVIVIARVVTGLGSRTRLSPKDVEGLFAADLAYLQDFYSIINFGTDEEIADLTASVDSARGARRYAPEVPATPSSPPLDRAPSAGDRSADGATDGSTDNAAADGAYDERPPTARRTTAAATKRTAAAAAAIVEAEVVEDDGAPRYDADGMELPSQSRRARVEEVGKSNERPKGAR